MTMTGWPFKVFIYLTEGNYRAAAEVIGITVLFVLLIVVIFYLIYRLRKKK